MHRLPRSLTLRQSFRHTPHFRRRLPISRTQFRKQSQYVYHADGQPVRLQNVRFQKPNLFTSRRIFTWAIYSGVAYGYLHYLWKQMDVEIEFIDEEEAAELDKKDRAGSAADYSADGPADAQDGEEAADYYADDENTFIPLTWAKQSPRTYYRGSDPEWKEFGTVAKDVARQKKIHGELAQIVYTGATQHPSISRQLGKDAKIGKYWLDIAFPDGPPQEYERSGIEIGDGFIALSTQKVSQEKQWRTMRALWPEATAGSMWAAMKVLAGIQYRRVKQVLGLENVDPGSPEQRWQHAMDIMAKQQGKGQGAAVEKKAEQQTDPGVNLNATSEESTRPTTTPSTSDKKAQPRQQPTGQGGLPWHIPQIPLPGFPSSRSSTTSDPASSPPPDASSTFPIAYHVFQAHLRKNWSAPAKKMEPPRGSFVVSGLVEVRGSRGRVLFDVQSAYDPKAGKFLTVSAAVRGAWKWRQSPKGGP